jgi:hypothetical protein
MPDRAPLAARLLALLTALATMLLAFFLFVRPWYRSWGATADEIDRSLPGDEIVPHPAAQETLGITIRAPVDRVWPWLAQIGQDRGGFYSFDLVENLVGCRVPTEDRLRPDRQVWRVGDTLWSCARDRAGGAVGTGSAILRVQLAGRALAFGTHSAGASAGVADDGSWAFVLLPADASTTRLVVRRRGVPDRVLLGSAFAAAAFEPVHFAMERRMLVGIQTLAEGRSRVRVRNDALVVLWAVELAVGVASVVGVLRRATIAQPLAGLVASCAVLAWLVLAQPRPIRGVPLVILSGVVLWGRRR